MNINKVILTGNLTRDPEAKQTATGIAVCSFTIAVNGIKDKTSFVDCTAWDKTAAVVTQHLRKGSKIGVVGRLEMQTWQSKDGQNRSKLIVTVSEIEFLSAKSSAPADGNQKAPEAPADEFDGVQPEGDDVPF